MKKPSKKTNPTTLKPPLATIARDKDSPKSPYLEEYQDFSCGRMKPVTDAFLDRMAIDLMDYAKSTNDVMRIEWFFVSRNIYPSTGRRWAERYDNFGKAYEMAKYIIGMRREQKGLERKYDSNLVAKSMAMYDPEWKKMMEWQAKLSGDNESGGTKIVIMEKFSDLDLLEKRD